MLPEVVGSTVRALIISLGGGLVTEGYISTDELNSVAGGVLVAIGLAWSIIQKIRAKKKETSNGGNV